MVKRRERGVEMMNKGTWSAEEDQKLVDYVTAHGDKKWRALPLKAGLKRCGKSCRLRWLNYLRPGIKRGNISEDEEDLIIRLHNLLGNRWSIIAGRIPGRTDNEIKNHWNTHLSKKSVSIDDLNNKISHGLDSASVLSPTDSSAELPPPIPRERARACGNDDYECLGSEEFDIDQLFSSLPMLDTYPGSSGGTELGGGTFEFEDLEQLFDSRGYADS